MAYATNARSIPRPRRLQPSLTYIQLRGESPAILGSCGRLSFRRWYAVSVFNTTTTKGIRASVIFLTTRPIIMPFFRVHQSPLHASSCAEVWMRANFLPPTGMVSKCRRTWLQLRKQGAWGKCEGDMQLCNCLDWEGTWNECDEHVKRTTQVLWMRPKLG